MLSVKSLNPSAPPAPAIVVAGCESLSETQAMARWILPVLQQWPRSAWHIWVTDATNCNDIKATKVSKSGDGTDWQPVSHDKGDQSETVCRILGGRAGLVIYANDIIAAAAARGLEGLVTGIACFPANDPLAQPFKKSFASFGVTAGI